MHGGTAPHLRPRSTASMVLSRSDPRPPTPTGEPRRLVPPSRGWVEGLKWVALGSAIAALWILLLLGDSLRPIAG